MEPFIQHVRRAYGNTRECGRISHYRWFLGRYGAIRMLPIDNNFIESEWWALKADLGKGFFIKALRSFLTARAAELLFPHRRLLRDTRLSKSAPRSYVSRLLVRMLLPGMDHNTMDTSVQRGTLCKPDETYCKVKAADGYTYYMAEALLDKFSASLQRMMSLHMRSLRNIKEQTLSVRNMSRCLHVRRGSSKTAQESSFRNLRQLRYA